ncbi:MAG: MAPEG family protein [Pseudomonadota bacterium]|nr:MAPEG family protein [Pseudomonadota bacterium]
MTTALWCVMVAGLLPYVAAVSAKWGAKGYDNRNPRAWLAAQTGFRARGNAAQANSFETFPFFAAAVLTATWKHAPQGTLDTLALVFIAARLLYLVAYLADWSTFRSACWFVAFAVTVGMFTL